MFTFLVGVVVVVGLIWLAVVAKWFRWVLSGFGLLVLAVALYFINDHYSQLREEEAAKHRIRLDQVRFEDLAMGNLNPGSPIGRITGRVRNNSPTFTLTGIELKVTVRDCVGEGQGQHCEIVGQTTTNSWTQIPPSQSRAFDESAFFSSVPPPKGHYSWDYQVVYVKGKQEN